MRTFAMIMVCLVLLSTADKAGKYPVSGFHSPVNRDIKLSGTFGELRTNHFHAGLDIKSMNGVSGDPIYATAEGFISRIKTDASGYGNSLYIDHPSGFTSVYAHLHKFSPEVEQYVKEEQYNKKSFTVDLSPAKHLFPVQKAQQIGLMGNTGYSLGPHLHFEIRHTEGQIPVNPLHFGFSVTDRIPPVVQQLIVYEYNETGTLLHSSVLQPKLISKGRYTLSQPLELASPMVAFGMRTYDSHDGVTNQNGIYSIQCKVDQEPSFAFSLDEIPFDKTRYLNAHIDYKQKLNTNRFFHRCHPLEGNKLPIYYTGTERGLIYLNAEQPRKVVLEAADFNGNISVLEFEVTRNHSLLSKAPVASPFLTIAEPDKVSIISQPGLQVVWPAGSFYEKTPLQAETLPSEGLGCFSPHYVLSPADVPVHYYFDIFIESLVVPPHLHEKVFIARCEPDGKIVNCGGKWIGNNLTTGVRQNATYTIMADTIAPKISVLHFGPKMTGWKRMAFKISDNFRTRDQGRNLLYSAWVDDQWILMSLDGKSGILTHEFDGRIPPGEHQLRLSVIDDRGNEAVFEKSFTL